MIVDSEDGTISIMAFDASGSMTQFPTQADVTQQCDQQQKNIFGKTVFILKKRFQFILISNYFNYKKVIKGKIKFLIQEKSVLMSPLSLFINGLYYIY